MTKPIIRILLADDHAMVREGLRSFLQLAEDIAIVQEAETAEQAMASADAEDLDVVIMDLVMPGAMNGIDAIRYITQNHPSLRVLALTSFQDEERILDALEAGAIGYLEKDVNPDDLLTAVRQAAAGRTVLEANAMELLRQRKFVKKPSGSLDDVETSGASGASGGLPSAPHNSASAELPGADLLTQRETEILKKLAKGYSNKEIGSELGITEKTVKVHVSHILSKLEVYDRTQAVIAASRMGIVNL